MQVNNLCDGKVIRLQSYIRPPCGAYAPGHDGISHAGSQSLKLTSRATLVIGLSPAADRPLCHHRCISRYPDALRRYSMITVELPTMIPYSSGEAMSEDSLKSKAYTDLAHPAAKEVGDVVGRAVRLALAPVRGLIWSAERAEEYIVEEIQKQIPVDKADQLKTPEPALLAPVVTGIMVAGDDSLRKMYLNLLANAMTEGSSVSHRSFAEVIKQITSSEARILNLVSSRRSIPTLDILAARKETPKQLGVVARYISTIGLEANVEAPFRTSLYLDNLVRLHLLDPFPVFSESAPDQYKLVESLGDIERLRHLEGKIGHVIQLRRTGVTITEYGKWFARACIPEAMYMGESIADRLNERVTDRLDLIERVVGKAQPGNRSNTGDAV